MLELDYTLQFYKEQLSLSNIKIYLCDNYLQVVGENGILKFNNIFFSKIYNDGGYIKKDNIPNSLEWFTYLDNKKIPIIYGENKLETKGDIIYCGLDILGSTFFMLTRWEEIVLPKDKFGRCNEDEMFVVKHNIYHRPIVNEYIELFSFLLNKIGVKTINKHIFKPMLTHDVDGLFRYDFKNLIKNLAGDLLHRKSLKEFFITCGNYLLYKMGKINDPYDTFDMLMDLSDKYGFKNSFYFMPTYKDEYDSRYDIRDKRILKIIENIKKREHFVGIHPSKSTFRNEQQFRNEVARICSICSSIEGGRQHYLLYDLPYTYRLWEKNHLSYDAGLGFASRCGFRCGTCFPFNFYDVLQRKILSIEIHPLIVMDAALLIESKETELCRMKLRDLINKVKKYNGEFVFLWHPDNFNSPEIRGYKSLYNLTLEEISKNIN